MELLLGTAGASGVGETSALMHLHGASDFELLLDNLLASVLLLSGASGQALEGIGRSSSGASCKFSMDGAALSSVVIGTSVDWIAGFSGGTANETC